MTNLKIKKTFNLTKKNKLDIYFLKETEWKKKKLSQKEWFEKNINKNDLHNLLYLKGRLIGYNCIRQFDLNKNQISKNVLLFDTLVINKNFRKLNLSTKIMTKSINIIEKSKKPCFLVCLKKHVNYYKKFGWKKIYRTKLNINLNKNKILMIYKK